ncbi:Uncharacterised protein [Raoultella ornithinolytica]|nr:Uncharacterised protein [Raoultella ornithinolytica]
MPFDMQPSQLAMNFNGTRSTLQGTVNTKQGQISLSGNADWTQIDNWRAQVAAKGSRVRITVPPMVRAGRFAGCGLYRHPRVCLALMAA